ncbi:hypothetical protein LCGC14_2113940 [marine sediment metagenome]|uniref:Uncharacterized protein n=1 Tax=marine sediment metagenome TaxID=412755 RepID=A0A0F9GJE0_9ZZZZ
MAINFDQAQRTMYLDFDDMPTSLAGVRLSPPNGQGKYPVILPYSEVNANGVWYIETSPFQSKFNIEANTLESVEYHRPLWGVIVTVERRSRNTGVASGEAQTNDLTSNVVLHKFGYGV